MKIKIALGGKIILVEDVEKCSFFGKFIGLMFKRKEKANALLFDFGKEVNTPIHSFFVFFKFIAIWLDGKNHIVDLKIVKPFSSLIIPKKKFVKLVEIPINSKYHKAISYLVGN